MSFKKSDFDQLRKAVDWSIKQLGTPREKRVEAIKQYVGSHYADDGAEKRVPTNFLELAVQIYVRSLAARTPRALVTTGSTDLKPYAKDLEIAINQVPDEVGLGDTMQKAVIEAMFAFAVAKVGLCPTGRRVKGIDPGELFVDLVSIDDYFCDMTAKSRNQIQFEGNDYWLTLDAAKDLYEGSGTIDADEHTTTGDDGGTRADSISSSEGADLYLQKVWLRDVWLPDSAQVVTYGVKSLKLYRVVDWDGPDGGPYHMLGFSRVPGNLLPLPPVALWRDLHELANSLFRKLGRQADSEKSVHAFAGGDDDAVNAFKVASDGDGIRYAGPEPKILKTSGVNPTTLAFYLQVKDIYNYIGGNLDALGGLAPTTDTVGQDKILGQAAGARVADMGDQVIKFARSIFKAIAWYEWTDPVRVRNIEKPVEGTDIVLRKSWSKKTRRGEFLDYNFGINPYSMQEDNPSIRLQKMGMALERFVFPMMEQIQQQGGGIDFKALLGSISKLSNLPELLDVVRFDQPIDDAPVSGDAKPSMKPAHTTRTYERVNRPGASRHGKDDVMARGLMGIGVQNSEAAVLGRQVS